MKMVFGFRHSAAFGFRLSSSFSIRRLLPLTPSRSHALTVQLFFFLLLTTGCHTYQYRIVQPSQTQAVVSAHPLALHYDPLEYTFSTARDRRLGLRITNPTTNQIVLRGDRSFVIDPQGESHPVPGTVIGAHSYARMFLPPRPATAEVVGYYGYPWAYGPGFYGYAAPFWHGYYDPFFYGPSVTYLQLNTPYDWLWKTGSIQLHLAYDRTGQPFEHLFEIIRERAP